jgi:hypothetical protein
VRDATMVSVGVKVRVAVVSLNGVKVGTGV